MKDEVGGTYNTHGGNEKYIQNFRRGIPKEETTWQT